MGIVNQISRYEVPIRGTAQRSALFEDMQNFMPRLENMGAIGSYSLVNGTPDYVTVTAKVLDPEMERVLDSKIMAYAGARKI